MASNILLISGGTNYYISGGGSGQTVYAGSGTPWTAQSTTPYEIGMNDTAGASWTPLASARQEVYGGGAPFRNGQTLIYDSYGNVSETLVIQCRATTHDNAVTLLQQLRKILNTALYSTPCVLAAQPNGATNTVYYDIYGADVQEDPRFINEEAGLSGTQLVRAIVSWRRSPFGGAASLSTLINGASFTNNGSSNTASLGAQTGDLVNEGQPLNIKIAESSGFVGLNFYMASYDLHTTTTVNTAATISGAAGASNTWTPTTLDINSVMTNRRLKCRLLARFKTLTNPSKMQFRCVVYPEVGGTTTPLITTNWIGPDSAWTTPYLDFGPIPIDAMRTMLASTAKIVVYFYIRTTDGTSVTATLDYHELLLYYDFARFITNSVTGSSSFYQQILAAEAVTSGGWLPTDPRGYQATTTGDRMVDGGVIRGTAPRAYTGASFFLAWSSFNDNHTTTHAAAVTAKLAALYKTLRGSG